MCDIFKNERVIESLPGNFVHNWSIGDALSHAIDGSTALVARLGVGHALLGDVTNVRDELVGNAWRKKSIRISKWATQNLQVYWVEYVTGHSITKSRLLEFTGSPNFQEVELKQWSPTFGSWRPTKQLIQFARPIRWEPQSLSTLTRVWRNLLRFPYLVACVRG